MKIDELYSTAKKYADKIKQEKSGFVSDDDAALCVIINDKQEIFTGVTGVRISGEKIETVHAEFNAIMAMQAAKQKNAKQMVTVLVKDGSVIKPCDACLDLLFSLSNDNNSCAVVTEPDKADSAMNLRFGTAEGSVDMFSGFDDEPAPKSQLGAPVEYAKGIVDESNPFNATSDDAQNEVVTFTGDSKSGDKAAEESVSEAQTAPETAENADVAQAAEASAHAADADGNADEGKAPALSKEELLKQAKERKKVTKANFKFWKR